MKSRLLLTTFGLSLMAALVAPIQLGAQEENPKHIRYTVIDLGTLGGTYSYAWGLNNEGRVAGSAATRPRQTACPKLRFFGIAARSPSLARWVDSTPD
jgi:hypothetical protein